MTNDLKDVTVLGSGIAGLSCAFHLQRKKISVRVLEKDDTYGGLCGNFSEGGFRFDRFVHFTFADNPYTREVLESGNEMHHHKPESSNYSEGYWLRHPVQNNLFPLPVEEKVNVISSFIEERPDGGVPQDYEEWLKFQYGDYFSRNYPMRYTQKYWTVPAKDLEVKWVGNRMHKPSIKEVLKGAFEEHEDINYYTKEMRYPQKGGYKSVLNKIKSEVDVEYGREIVRISPHSKTLHFSDGTTESYEKLVSSLPLNRLAHMIDGAPADVLEAADDLLCTGGYLVYFGFNRPDVPKKLWFYIYDEDILPSRVFSPSLKSADNAPPGKSSLLAEIYFSDRLQLEMGEGELLEHVKQKMIAMGVFAEEDLEVLGIRKEEFANVVFTHSIYESRDKVKEYIEGQLGIELVGRFGEWDYFWSNQSFESGQAKAEKIAEAIK